MTEPSPPPPADAAAPPAPSVPKKPRGGFRRKLLKWTGITLGTVLVVLIAGAALLYARGRALLRQTHDVRTALTVVPTDSASIARGEHIAIIHGCHFCHGDQLQGKEWLDIPPAKLVPQNLTRGVGGVGSNYSAVDWDRAVRYGVRPNGRPLLPFMPYEVFNRLNDADMAALAAYLSSRPAVNNQPPPMRVKPLGYIVLGVSGLPRDRLDAPRSIVAPGATPEYGSYVTSTTCVACHGERLQGSKRAGGPGLHAYGQMDIATLTRALRTGVAADGRRLNPEMMPWQAFQRMDDTEIGAIHAHLRSLASQP